MDTYHVYQSNSGNYVITYVPGENEGEWTVKKVEVFFEPFLEIDEPVDVAIPDSFNGMPITDIDGYISYKCTMEWSSDHPDCIGKITIGKNVKRITNLELWDEEFEFLIIPKTVEVLEEMGVDSYNPSPIYFERDEMFDRFYSDLYAIDVYKYSEVAPDGFFEQQRAWHYNAEGLPVSWYEELNQ